jgi:hypothetical protein
MATVIVSDRQEALRLGYEATDWSNPIAFEDYEFSLKDWNVQLIQRDGENIGAVYKKDGEVHVSILPKWRKRWATKGLINELFGGKVTTKVAPGHEYMHGILARLGFVLNEDQIFAKG